MAKFVNGEKFTTLAHGVKLYIYAKEDKDPKLVWPDGREKEVSIDRAMLILQNPQIFDEHLAKGPQPKDAAHAVD